MTQDMNTIYGQDICDYGAGTLRNSGEGFGGRKAVAALRKDFSRFLRFAAVLLLMVVGVNTALGQVTPTTDTNGNSTIEDSEKQLYLIQTQQFESFYITPNGENLNTANLPHSSMLWYFLEAEYDAVNNIQYYYIVNNNTGKYIYNTDYTKNNNDGRLIKLGDLDPNASDKFKFYLIEEGTTGYYYIYIKQNNRKWLGLNKQSGNVSSNPIRLTDSQYIDNINSRWKFVPYKGTLAWPDPPFTPSTDLEKHYYKIRNKKADSYYISTNPNTSKVIYSSTEGNEMVWYFKEASSDGLMTYYYVINPEAGNKYMYYDGNTDANDKTSAVSIKDINDANAVADRFLFVIVQAAATVNNSDEPDNGYYMIVPKLLIGNLWKSNSLGTKSASDGSDMNVIPGRVSSTDAYPHWSFEPVWADPEISCDETGTITITGEDGADFYYTTDGSTVPTADPSLLYEESSKPSVSAGITTIKVRAIAEGKSDSRVITQKIVYVPNQTFASSTYDGTAQVPVVQVDEETISPDEYNISYKLGETDVTECKDAGTYTVEITDVDGGEYIVYGSGSFTIDEKPLTIIAEAKSKTYGDADPELTYTSEGLVEGDAITGALSRDAGEIVNTYAITQGTLSAGDNYLISYTGANLTITQKALTITANSDSKVYDGTALTNDGYTNTALATGDVIESVTITGSQTDKGSSDNVASAAVIKNGETDVTACYDITYVNGTLSVTGRVITITAASDEKVYDGTALTNGGYTYDNTKLEEGDEIESVTVTGSQTVAGSSDNVPSAAVIMNGETDVTANYDFTYENGTLTVTPKALTITAEATSKTYGDADPELTYTSEGLVEGDAITGALSRAEGELVGTYAISQGTLTAGDNYTISFTGANLTISQKALTITADSDEKEYDGTPLTKNSYSNTALATGDVIESVTVTGSQTDKGSSDNVPSETVIKNGETDVTTCYDITYVNGTLTISGKLIGDGALASGFTISFDAENNIILKDGETTLTIINDYTIDDEVTTSASGRYSIRTVRGTGNYGGYASIRNAIVTFTNDGNGGSEYSATFVAESANPDADPEDTKGHALPEGITAYTITAINDNTVTTEALDYIPEGVPVLLLSNTAIGGFQVQDLSGQTPPTGTNLLKEVTDDSKHFEVKTIYLLYKNEFAYNKEGDLAKWKVYLEPPTPSPARLVIKWDTEGGIDTSLLSPLTSQLPEKWYSFDGRRLNGKPTKKGLYIRNGKVVVIK